MAKKKVTIQGAEKQKNNPSKEKFVCTANVYHKDVIAGLQRKYRLAMRMKNYDEASLLYKKLEAAHKEHRNLIYRRDHVKV